MDQLDFLECVRIYQEVQAGELPAGSRHVGLLGGQDEDTHFAPARGLLCSHRHNARHSNALGEMRRQKMSGTRSICGRSNTNFSQC